MRNLLAKIETYRNRKVLAERKRCALIVETLSYDVAAVTKRRNRAADVLEDALEQIESGLPIGDITSRVPGIAGISA